MGVVGKWGDNLLSNANGSMRNARSTEMQTPGLIEPYNVSGRRTAEWTSLRGPINYVAMHIDRINPQAEMIVQIGDSGGYETSGYINSAVLKTGSTTTTKTNRTSGFGMLWSASAGNDLPTGFLELRRVEGNRWLMKYMLTSLGSHFGYGIGRKTLSGELDRIKFTSSVNVSEGRIIGIQYQ